MSGPQHVGGEVEATIKGLRVTVAAAEATYFEAITVRTDVMRRVLDAFPERPARGEAFVHNHGTEAGPGLACNEVHIGGNLIGACLLAAYVQAARDEERARVLGEVDKRITDRFREHPRAVTWLAEWALHVVREARGGTP